MSESYARAASAGDARLAGDGPANMPVLQPDMFIFRPHEDSDVEFRQEEKRAAFRDARRSMPRMSRVRVERAFAEPRRLRDR